METRNFTSFIWKRLIIKRNIRNIILVLICNSHNSNLRIPSLVIYTKASFISNFDNGLDSLEEHWILSQMKFLVLNQIHINEIQFNFCIRPIFIIKTAWEWSHFTIGLISVTKRAKVYFKFRDCIDCTNVFEKLLNCSKAIIRLLHDPSYLNV